VNPFRWVINNFSILILAIVLALVVWVSAVITADPNEEQTYGPVQIEIIGQGSGLLLVSENPEQVYISMRAPRSIWEQMNNDPELVEAWIDLSGLGPGEHIVDVNTFVDINPIRYVKIEPQKIQLNLEQLARKEVPVELLVTGELPLGYKKGDPSLEPDRIVVEGPVSLVTQVTEALAHLDISGSTETIIRSITVDIIDESGELVSGVNLSPGLVNVSQPISLLGGFKNVAVKVVTTGQVANGYRLTNILVAPPTVTLFSDDPQLIDQIPGFVETLSVDLTDLSDDIEISVGLNLPEKVSAVLDPTVLVQVGVAAVEGSLTLSLPMDVIGLSPDLVANISPNTVDLIVAGPLNVLDRLTPDDFQIALDLNGLPPGVYQRAPIVESLQDQIRVQTTLPETVEVTIELAPTATPTATMLTSPGTSTPPPVTPTTTTSP